MQWIVKLVDAEKLGGWVRAGVASLLGVGLAKWPALAAFVGPEMQVTIAVAVSGLVVGIWSHLAKKLSA